MAKKELYLPELKKGYYIFWNICTQCYNSCTVEMKGDNGDGNCYFKYSKTSTDTGLTVMGEDSTDLKDNDLKIMIDIPAASSIKTSNNSSIITDSDGLTVGKMIHSMTVTSRVRSIFVLWRLSRCCIFD